MTLHHIILHHIFLYTKRCNLLCLLSKTVYIYDNIYIQKVHENGEAPNSEVIHSVGRRGSSMVRSRPSESVKDTDTDDLTRSLGAAPPGLVEALAQVGGLNLVN